MKTTNLNRILIFIVLISFFTSCSVKKTDHTNAIPKDVKLIAAFDFESLSQKANFKEGNYKFVDLLVAQVGNSSPEIAKIIEAAEKDASSTGIDIEEKAYVFLYQKESRLLGSVIKLADAGKFETLLKEIIKTTGEELTIQEDEGIKYLQGPGNKKDAIISWNKNFMIVIGNADQNPQFDFLAEAKLLFNQKSSESAKSTPLFKKLSEKEADIAYGFDFSLYTEIAKQQLGNQQMPIPINMNNIYGLLEGGSMTARVNFNKGEIRSDMDYMFGEKMKELMDKYPMGKTFDNTVLPLFVPNKALGLMSVGLNFKNYYGFLKEVMGPGMFAMGEMALENQMGIKMEDLLNSIKGDVLFTFADLSGKAQNMMADINMAFSLNDDKLNEKLNMLLSMAGQRGENYYTLEVGGQMPIYLAMNDKLILATTNKNTADAYAKGGLGELSLSKTDFNNVIGKYSGYMFMDIESILNLEIVKGFMSNPFIAGNPAAAEMISLFKSLEFHGQMDPPNATGILKLDTEKNSLQAIMEGIDKIVN